MTQCLLSSAESTTQGYNIVFLNHFCLSSHILSKITVISFVTVQEDNSMIFTSSWDLSINDIFFDASCSRLWEASFPWKDWSRQEVVVNEIECTCKPTYAFNLLRLPILLSDLCRNYWWSSASACVVLYCYWTCFELVYLVMNHV